MPWCASVFPCPDGHATSVSIDSNWTRDRCAGMVESRQKVSDASGAAGSQQGCSDKRMPRKDMWVRSSTEGNVLHNKYAGEPVHVPVFSQCRVPIV